MDYLWNFSGKDEQYILFDLEKEGLTEDKWLNKLFKNKILFNHQPKANSKIVNSTNINFQQISREFGVLINKKALPFDLNFMSKF